MASHEEIKTLLESDPGNPAFVEYAEELRRSGDLAEAMEICLAGLSANPSSLRGRLVLARVFYENGYIPFAARELAYLRRARPESESLRKLCEELGVEALQDSFAEAAQVSSSQEAAEVVAETEFDLDVLESLSEEKKGN